LGMGAVGVRKNGRGRIPRIRSTVISGHTTEEKRLGINTAFL